MTDTKTMIEQLRAVTFPHPDDERYTQHAEQTARLCLAAADRIEEQAAVVERLGSRTTDGVLVLNGDDYELHLVYKSPNGRIVGPADYFDLLRINRSDKPEWWVGVYSTEEAAIEAARNTEETQ